ncbi:uncharacterized protein LOC133800069 [Humulus lupulus]|uniref:uncharacterized protein LOC133800069 n=1 Tax=Humulus lupulus TaxID=3486 RepID=UPI002B40CBF8|nr:uncharacterized protein LOC133800069 [Humulus lupulus]
MSPASSLTKKSEPQFSFLISLLDTPKLKSPFLSRGASGFSPLHLSKFLRRSLAHYNFKKQQLFEPFLVTGLISTPQSDPQTYCYQTHRTLILDRSPSQLVQLNKLSNSNSGIVELTLNKLERRNATGRDFLRGFIEFLEVVSKDSSTNVVLIRSLVPKVFCAGNDLKVLLLFFFSSFFWSYHPSYFLFCKSLGRVDRSQIHRAILAEYAGAVLRVLSAVLYGRRGHVWKKIGGLIAMVTSFYFLSQGWAMETWTKGNKLHFFHVSVTDIYIDKYVNI